MTIYTPGSSAPSSPVSNPLAFFDRAPIERTLAAVLIIFEKATCSVEAESVAKDLSHLLHSVGATHMAITALQASIVSNWKSRRSQAVFLSQLRMIADKPVAPITSRCVFVEVIAPHIQISLDSLRRVFPNIQKIWRVILARHGRSCLIEFASHSSARRAVDSRQHVPSHGPQDNTIKCAWVAPNVDIPPLRLEPDESFPVMEYAVDESIISPSLDWRRPRPRTGSDFSRDQDAFASFDLTTILRCTGAFDDYPPLTLGIRI
jgi:hypothetical protein